MLSIQNCTFSYFIPVSIKVQPKEGHYLVGESQKKEVYGGSQGFFNEYYYEEDLSMPGGRSIGGENFKKVHTGFTMSFHLLC